VEGRIKKAAREDRWSVCVVCHSTILPIGTEEEEEEEEG